MYPVVTKWWSWVFAGVKTVDLVFDAADTTKSSAADTSLVGWFVLWAFPVSGAADQVIELVSLWSDGSVTLDLSAATTAAVTYRVLVIPTTWDYV